MNILILGGDKRLVELKKKLEKNNHNVKSLFLNYKDNSINDINEFDTVFLPIPFLKNNFLNAPFHNEPISVDYILNMLKNFKGTIIGGLNDSSENLLSQNNLKFLNILKDEKFTLINAIITAEGTIQKLINESDISLFESKVCILGYGRVSKALARRLDPLCENLTIYNNPSINYIYSKVDKINSKTIDNFPFDSKNFNIIVNTIPSLIINKEIINNLNPSCLIVDLASIPGGVDFKYAEEKNIKTIHYLGIPGKVSSKSAAKAMYNFILEHI